MDYSYLLYHNSAHRGWEVECGLLYIQDEGTKFMVFDNISCWMLGTIFPGDGNKYEEYVREFKAGIFNHDGEDDGYGNIIDIQSGWG